MQCHWFDGILAQLSCAFSYEYSQNGLSIVWCSADNPPRLQGHLFVMPVKMWNHVKIFCISYRQRVVPSPVHWGCVVWAGNASVVTVAPNRVCRGRSAAPMDASTPASANSVARPVSIRWPSKSTHLGWAAEGTLPWLLLLRVNKTSRPVIQRRFL